MTKLADPKPPYCAACFSHPGEQRCVDFEAAYDGPVIPGSPEPIPVDDLIICESCLAVAFDILDPQNLRQTIEELVQLLRDARADLAAKDKMIQGFRLSTNELIDHPIARLPGRPKLEGVPDDVRQELNRAGMARRGTTTARKDLQKKKVAA